MGLLRTSMPITAATFIVGWLAIAGVPPLAGFWSKDEILLFALAKSPALYIVGLVTAVLTAYYMTRQVVMVFFGEARWEDRAAEHGAHGDFKPHESPWIMLTPLVVLAAAVDRRRDHPAARRDVDPRRRWRCRLEHWLEPVVEFGEADIAGTWGYDNKTILMLIATAAAVARHRRRLARLRAAPRSRPSEPTVLANAWYYDRAVTDFMGGPGRKAFEAAAWFDANVVDGAVNGAGRRPCARRPVSCARARPASCAATPRSSASAPSACSRWFVVVRGIL